MGIIGKTQGVKMAARPKPNAVRTEMPRANRRAFGDERGSRQSRRQSALGSARGTSEYFVTGRNSERRWQRRAW